MGCLKVLHWPDLLCFGSCLKIPFLKKIGFDAFGKFPNTDFSEDKELRQHFIDVAGREGISKKQLYDVLENKG